MEYAIHILQQLPGKLRQVQKIKIISTHKTDSRHSRCIDYGEAAHPYRKAKSRQRFSGSKHTYHLYQASWRQALHIPTHRRKKRFLQLSRSLSSIPVSQVVHIVAGFINTPEPMMRNDHWWLIKKPIFLWSGRSGWHSGKEDKDSSIKKSRR